MPCRGGVDSTAARSAETRLVATAGVMRARSAVVPWACSAKPSQAPPAMPSVSETSSRDSGCSRWLSAAPLPAVRSACWIVDHAELGAHIEASPCVQMASALTTVSISKACLISNTQGAKA